MVAILWLEIQVSQFQVSQIQSYPYYYIVLLPLCYCFRHHIPVVKDDHEGILLPFCKSSHWMLAVVGKGVIMVLDSLSDEGLYVDLQLEK